MTRLELLRLVIGRARKNGFSLRRWYTTRLGLPWINAEAATALLDAQKRYYALVFSHEFAQSFWAPGSEISFDVPARTFQRVMPDGSTRTVQSRPYIRRSVRPLAWKYHLRQMALEEEPLRYLRKYLHIEEDLSAEPAPQKKPAKRKKPGGATSKLGAKRGGAGPPKPLPPGLPVFLQRPYRPPLRPAP